MKKYNLNKIPFILNRNFPFSILILGYILLFVYIFSKGYFLGDSTFWIGLGLVIYILLTNEPAKPSKRFLIPTILLLIASFWIPTYSIRYILLSFGFVYTIESLWGRLNSLLIYLLLIMSMLFSYVAEVFTFPIRLELSKIVGKILQTIGFQATISGNLIQLNGSDFEVEPACMGLQMIGISLLISIFLIAHYQRITKKSISELSILGVLFLTFLLNIFSNLIRMTLLVIFKILPQNPLHDIVGLICLIAYVSLPMMFLVKLIFKKISFDNPVQKKALPIGEGDRRFGWEGLLLIFPLTTYSISQTADNQTITNQKINPNVKVLPNGVQQIKNEKSLVYYKNIPAFYSGEHNPYICWCGSGYEFKSIKETNLNNRQIYTATLQKGKDKLYTAWWFSDGKSLTISQLDWRWKMFVEQKKYFLVNVTANNQMDLQDAIEKEVLSLK